MRHIRTLGRYFDTRVSDCILISQLYSLPVPRLLLSARAAGVVCGVVVDDGGTRSASWARFTSANAAASAAASVGGASRTIVGSLRRDAPPALIFIISAWEAGTAAH